MVKLNFFHCSVLYHLTQLTSAVNPKTKPFQVKGKKQNEFKKAVDDTSYDSVPKIEKSHMDMLIGKLNLHTGITTLGIKKNNVCITLDQISTKISKRNLEKNNKWKVSYVSGSTFTENKHGFPSAQFTEPLHVPIIYLPSKWNYRTLCALCIKNPFTNHVQIRSFKTKHSINVELKKPTFISKFKKYFSDTEQSSHDHREPDLEKIKLIFRNSNVSAEEQGKLKSAFIEGYEAGLQRQTRVRSIWSRAVSTLIFGFFVTVIVLISVASQGGVFRFTIGRRSEIDPEAISVTLNDVKGVPEAKQELKDVVEFLRSPEKFSALGGKLPKGVLLVGPPGTGKTLLARAVAGEAGVPFFHASGSEFDEVLVGQGARRVRDLFKTAKERAPAVIFIDEIDSVGARRTNSVLHPYANQTINQLLSEMDGFLQNEGVIVLGATNRRDDLDKALLRPGRFDLQIYVNKPDVLGRKEILDLYLSRILTRDIDVDYLARCTTGFTGADIENMVNQAALRAAIKNADFVTMQHLEYARDKVIMGPEGRVRSFDEEGNIITAYHEAGHALVSYYTKDAAPIHKVTIIPHGLSLGYTSFLPDKDTYHVTKSQLLATMDSMMGGRAAEELIFGPDKVTTGAANDLEQATVVAEEMVKSYGMSEKVGFRAHAQRNKYLETKSEYGPSTNELIDIEVKRLLQESYDRAKTILKAHAKEHKQIADALLKYETLDADDIKAIVNGKKARIETLNKQPPIVDPSKHVL
ncbi:PREDICTED: ATP-dependent zinc metalloprotease YME1 homolog [Dufourea novaeangliae]|uniref:ATP-dependent zinc metalloprotease YME1 homolog n=1 Tax=Dufourea novaeangliae TaxID=178035 RepID=UPI000767D4EF|nr:PREDICTED: ATP-dependent zinc metalloprotease YME1 homolog [Dufourea novaeangliae]